MDEKIIQSTKEYRKLPVRALRCMYTADLVACAACIPPIWWQA